MSMIDAIPLLAGAGADGYQISRSVRLRSSASAYFNRTPASAGNRKTWTWSGWVKRGRLSVTNYLFSAPSTSSSSIFFSGVDRFHVTGASGAQFNLETTSVYRDISAWYHIVVALDTTQATSTDRLKIYVNGNQLTAFASATYPSLNLDGEINNNIFHQIGRPDANTHDGYLTEINFIDGQALTPSSFGETNAITGVWQPKKYGGTYGTNGFYLNFSDNSGVTATTIGKDYSGNGNNWTPSAGISITAGATYDSMTDVPTLTSATAANYCVLNPLSVPAYTYAGGNLNVSGTTANTYAPATIVLPTTGKYYFEYVCTNTAGANRRDTMGVVDLTQTKSYLSNIPNTVVYFSLTGAVYTNGSTLTTYASYTNGDVVQCAIDCETGKVWFGLNGSFNGSPSAGTGQVQTLTNNGSLAFAVGNQDNSGSYSLNGSTNFGQRPFTYTPPTGFVALNTQNLPTPTISNGANYMAATLWTGNGTSQSISNAVNGISFQPDMVWVKDRSAARSHVLIDAVRGTGLTLFPNETTADQSNTDRITSFNSNGFSVGAGLGTNANTETYVGWQWNAGGSTVTNTSGSISAQVRANPTAGFSVVTYTGTGANATVGHGLGVAPKMIIVKRRDAATNWPVWHTSISSGTNDFVQLNLTTAKVTDATFFTSTAPTSSVFSLGTGSGQTNTGSMVAYCFAAVAGYSAFGKYTGNGSADGPFVFTGFRPRFVMTKRTDSTGGWVMLDSARDSYNVSGNILQAESSAAELAVASYPTLDILSNGFKIRSSTIQNASGGTYIFMAVAENSFKLSLAR